MSSYPVKISSRPIYVTIHQSYSNVWYLIALSISVYICQNNAAISICQGEIVHGSRKINKKINKIKTPTKRWA